MRRKKLRKSRKDRASEQCITRRGLPIHQKRDQIKTLTWNRWDVAFRDTEGVWCRVSFAGESPTCECAYHAMGKECMCKHIAAVEHILPIRSRPSHGKGIALGRQDLGRPTARMRNIPATGGTAAGRDRHTTRFRQQPHDHPKAGDVHQLLRRWV
ncbi:MAG: hypothetical protein IS632_01830 [Thaumarchaeota archaeon]|nr:hypothetical protein [Nitrososphaerota archaeon]